MWEFTDKYIDQLKHDLEVCESLLRMDYSLSDDYVITCRYKVLMDDEFMGTRMGTWGLKFLRHNKDYAKKFVSNINKNTKSDEWKAMDIKSYLTKYSEYLQFTLAHLNLYIQNYR